MATVERIPATLSAKRKVDAIQLRIAGHTQDEVASKLGVTQQRVSAIETEWLASRAPSMEVTESRRQMQLAGIDAVRARLVPHVMKPLRSFEGTIIYGEDDEPVMVPDVQIVDRLAKLWEREAKLVGLDLQRDVNVTLNVTAEGIAAALQLDTPDAVVDVVAIEVTDGEATDGEA